jgi:hypothetical protein
MSYDNFKQKVWATGIQKDLERLHVFADGVNKEYEGVIKDLGDTVRIKQIGKPTITVQTLDETKTENGIQMIGRDLVLGEPETVPDSALTVVVDHRALFNYKVKDIDEAQGAKGVMDALNSETSEGLADVHDRFIADLVKSDPGVTMFNNGTAVALTLDNLFTTLDAAQQVLFENDVKTGTEIDVFIPFWVHTLLRQGYIKTDTDNSSMLKNGMVARYGSMNLKASNNVATRTVGSGSSAHEEWLIQMRTRRAVSFVHQATHLEPYRPEKDFSDAIKGFDLYGGRITRPKEIITIPVKKA